MTKISVNIFGHLLEKIKLKESYVSTEYEQQEERRRKCCTYAIGNVRSNGMSVRKLIPIFLTPSDSSTKPPSESVS